MCFNFHHLKVDYKDGDKWALAAPDYKRLKELFMQWQLGMQAGGGWNALFWCNHDQPRIVSRMGDEGDYWKESAKMLAGMIHLMRGTPYIYQGEEIGMLNAHYSSIGQYRDVESLNYYQILLGKGRTEEEALQGQRKNSYAVERRDIWRVFRGRAVAFPVRRIQGGDHGRVSERGSRFHSVLL